MRMTCLLHVSRKHRQLMMALDKEMGIESNFLLEDDRAVLNKEEPVRHPPGRNTSNLLAWSQHVIFVALLLCFCCSSPPLP